MAYAVVTSLFTTIEQVFQFNPSLISENNKGSIDCLCATLGLFQVFLEEYTGNQNIHDQEAFNFLEEKIRDAGYKAEDTIDSCLRRIHVAGSKHNLNKAHGELYDELQQIIEVMDSIQGDVMKFKNDQQNIKDISSVITSDLRSSGRVLEDEENSTLVGMKDDLDSIKDQLLRQNTPELKVVSIVGMGGLGKTTLARRIFIHPSVHCRFDVSSWVTVSQDYDVREMLLDVLSYGTPGARAMYHGMNEGELLEQVYRKLKRKRYIIILDDIWSLDAWDEVKRSFPDDENGSRIMITTRISEVADSCSGNGYTHHIPFLNLEDSWKLLSYKVFGKEEYCPDPKLEKIGKLIAQQCQGLPLSLVVIGGLLSNINRTYDDWKRIADNVNSHIGSTSEQCLAILGLSYNYLPCSLKACFLYMGVFLEDAEIDADRLIRVWIAEGFLKRISLKRPEEVAEECLEDLVNRSLIMVSSRGRVSGTIRSCRIHDLLRILCLREGKASKFFHVVNKCYQEGMEIEHRRLFLHEDAVRDQNLGLEKGKLNSVRTILCIRQPQTLLSYPGCYKIVDPRFHLLRVLDVVMIHFHCFPTEITQLVHLRYLAIITATSIPASISNLWNLQTLIVIPAGNQLSWPVEIWNMSSLRHFRSGGISMPVPAPPKTQDFSGLYNLEEFSLNTASFNWIEIFKAVPNVKGLDVVIDADPNGWSHLISGLICLTSLQTLRIHLAVSVQYFRRPRSLVWQLISKSLKSLTLAATHYLWEDMTILGNLPNLEVLKLEHFAFQGSNWELAEGGFNKLKLLDIHTTNLVHWTATSDSLPILEYLVLRYCYKLEEIPTEIGDIPTMKLIELHYCSQAAVTCAEEILEEQRSFGNELLVVRAYSTSVQFGVMKGEEDEEVAVASSYGPDVSYNYNLMG